MRHPAKHGVEFAAMTWLDPCMQTLTTTAYQTLIQGAEVLEADSFGPKVMKLADGSFLKLFRRKRLISSEVFAPYAKRFADNATALLQNGVPAPEVIELYKVEAPPRTAVHYRGLPGVSLRQAMREAAPIVREQLAEKMGHLLAYLHETGIYFRSLHLGNVLLLPDYQLGLIDFADMRFEGTRLTRGKRKRNLKHMQRYDQDRKWLFEEHRDALCKGYREVCNGTDNPLENIKKPRY